MKKGNELLLLLFFLLYTNSAMSQEIIAHRGFWKTEGSAQNSITALMKADSIGVYGSEVDLWISADGVPVVNHDATVILNGKQLRVEETPFNILRQLDPQAKVYNLNGDMSPGVLSTMGVAGPDYNYNVLFQRPQWVKEAHELGQKVNVWTVNRSEDIQKVIDLKVDFITTDEPVRVKEILQK